MLRQLVFALKTKVREETPFELPPQKVTDKFRERKLCCP